MKTFSSFLMCALLLPSLAHSQSRVAFRVPILFQALEGTTRTDTLWLGINGDGPGFGVDNTYLADDAPEFGPYGLFREVLTPPDPPVVTLRSRFEDTPGRPSRGGNLRPWDYRGFTSPNQVDTFSIRVYGDAVLDYGARILWPSNLASFASAWIMRPQVGNPFAPLNMLTQTSLELNATGGPFRILIIKTGAINDPQLPVQLSSFNAVVRPDRHVRIEWTTQSETNNYGFEVQRANSAQGSFQTIPNGFVPGHGTTTEPRNYAVLDAEPIAADRWYRLKQIDFDGTVNYIDPIRVQSPTSVNAEVPAEFALGQNYPNPFNPSTGITYSLPTPGAVTITVHSMLGQEVSRLVDAKMAAGTYTVRFNANGLPTGAYFYRMESQGFVAVRTMMLVK